MPRPAMTASLTASEEPISQAMVNRLMPGRLLDFRYSSRMDLVADPFSLIMKGSCMISSKVTFSRPSKRCPFFPARTSSSFQMGAQWSRLSCKGFPMKPISTWSSDTICTMSSLSLERMCILISGCFCLTPVRTRGRI